MLSAGSLRLFLALLLPAVPAAAQHDHAQTRPHQEQSGHRHEGGVQHDFSEIERWVAAFEDPARSAWQRPAEVLAALKLRKGMAVADVGAGTGYFAAPMARAVGESGVVYAADVEPAMVEYLRDRADRERLPSLVPVLCSYDDPRLPTGGVDLVFVCDTWHHVEDRVDYARRLRDDLSPGGRLVIVDFQKRELPVGPPLKHKLSPSEVTAELEQAGWWLVESHDFLPYQYVLVYETVAD